MNLSPRQRQILNSFDSTGNQSETARYLGLSRQRVNQVVQGHKKGTLNYCPTLSYKDTGCPDGEYLSCLDCPLEKCKCEGDG